MVYTGTRDSENTIKNYQQILKRKLEPKVRAINKQLRQDMPKIIMEAKNEILGVFQIVAYEQFQRTFYKYYGNNYDVNMLNNSLSFSIDDRLQPHLTYTVKDFYVDTDFSEDKRAFNQNANIEGSFGRLMEFDVLDAMEDIDFFGLSIYEDSPYDWVAEEETEPSKRDIFRKKRKIFNPSEIYKEAYANTMEEFDVRYQTMLLPKINKKFNL